MNKKTVILFDIDGTLVDTHGAGRTAFVHAVCQALEIDDDLNHVSFAGATDLNIFRTICEQHHIETSPEREQRFFVLLEHSLAAALDASNSTLLPGVIALLDALQRLPDMDLGLLTGNIERGAQIKLESFGLNQYFEFGAYGNEFALRADIARKARQRALERAKKQPTKLIVIGDTPLDVLAAHAIGACCIAVATGHFSENELRASNAEYVFPDLTNIEMILDLVDPQKTP